MAGFLAFRLKECHLDQERAAFSIREMIFTRKKIYPQSPNKFSICEVVEIVLVGYDIEVYVNACTTETTVYLFLPIWFMCVRYLLDPLFLLSFSEQFTKHPGQLPHAGPDSSSQMSTCKRRLRAFHA